MLDVANAFVGLRLIKRTIKAELQKLLDQLTHEHDEHMKHAYEQFVGGEDPATLWAYGAGLFHAMRRLEDFIEIDAQR